MLGAGSDLLELKRRLRDSLKREQGEVKTASGDRLFLLVKDHEKIPISPETIHLVMAGDRIQAIVREASDGTKFCEPEKLLGRYKSVVLAKLLRRQDHWFASPMGSAWIKWRLETHDIKKIMLSRKLCDQDWVQIEILQHPLFCEVKTIESEEPKAWQIKMKRWVGHQNDPFLLWRYELIKADLPPENPFKDKKLVECDERTHQELVRTNLVDLPWITIDSEQTQDIDDAICARECDEESYEVLVAITDVDEAVSEGSSEDAWARELGSTIYLPGYRVPMLPVFVSDEQASLLKGERRAAIVCRVRCDKQSHAPITDPIFETCWIQVKERWSYPRLEKKIFSTGDPDVSLDQSLYWLKAFAQGRLFYRLHNLSTSIDRKEYEYGISPSGKLLFVRPKPRLCSEKLIESLMIFANQALGEWSVKNNISGIVYTKHEGFSAQQQNQRLAQQERLGLNLSEEYLDTQEGFWKLQQFFQKHLEPSEFKKTIYYAPPASLTYTPEAHRPLGVKYYATWTSPLRKYCDLMNLRLLKGVLLGSVDQKSPQIELLAHLQCQRKKIRQCDRAMAVRLSTKMLKEQLSQLPNKSKLFAARVVAVLKKGLSVFIDSLNMEALVPFSDFEKIARMVLFPLVGQAGWIANKQGDTVFVLDRLIIVKLTLQSVQKSGCIAHYHSGFEEDGLWTICPNSSLKTALPSRTGPLFKRSELEVARSKAKGKIS